MQSGSPQTITLPNQTNLFLSVGWVTQIMREGTGTVSFAAQSPDTIQGITSIAAQWDIVEVYLAVSGGAPGIANTWIIRKI